MRLKYFNITNCYFDYGAKEWTPLMVEILKQNWRTLTAAQLGKAVRMSRTKTRMKLYELGLKKIEMEYWTDEQIQFLIDHYKTIGNVELAETFEAKWPKNKRWTKNHIDKKRNYLGLKRTEQELIDIEQRNLDQGRLNTHMKKGKSNFLTSGPAKEDEIRMYRNTNGIIESRIRIGKRWVRWPRWAYIKYHGPIPQDHVVILKDNNPYNTVPDNLEVVTRAEATRRNAAKSAIQLSDAFIAGQLTYRRPDLREAIKQMPQVIEAKRTLLLLKREIKKLKDVNRKKTA